MPNEAIGAAATDGASAKGEGVLESASASVSASKSASAEKIVVNASKQRYNCQVTTGEQDGEKRETETQRDEREKERK